MFTSLKISLEVYVLSYSVIAKMKAILACFVLCLGLTCVQSNNIFEYFRNKWYCQFLPSGCNHGALPTVAQKQGETELVKLLKKADLNGVLADPKGKVEKT